MLEAVCYNHSGMMQLNKSLFAVAAMVVDVLTFAVSQSLLPQLIQMMSAPDGINALLVAGTFFLFAGGVFSIRRLKSSPQGVEIWLTRGQRSALALFFAFVLSLTLAWQLGFFESASQVDTTQMGEGGAASYFVFGPGAWLAFSLLYVLVFAFKVEPVIVYGRAGYWLAALFGLVATAAMLLVMVAQATVIATTIGAFWWAFTAFTVLAVLFLPPRLLYLSRVTGLQSPAAYGAVITLLLLLVLFASQMV